jgi:ribosomal protein L22
MARAMGRASAIRKLSCHIAVTVTDEAAAKKTKTSTKGSK